MKIRADIAELLRQGLSDRAIARQLGVHHTTAARARQALHIPRVPGGTRRATIRSVFHFCTISVRGGHLDWVGHRNNQGTPLVRIAGTSYSAYRVAFGIRYDRDPVGKVLPGCGHEGCVAPEHVEDRTIRERNRATYAAIFGGTS